MLHTAPQWHDFLATFLAQFIFFFVVVVLISLLILVLHLAPNFSVFAIYTRTHASGVCKSLSSERQAKLKCIIISQLGVGGGGRASAAFFERHWSTLVHSKYRKPFAAAVFSYPIRLNGWQYFLQIYGDWDTCHRIRCMRIARYESTLLVWFWLLSHQIHKSLNFNSFLFYFILHKWHNDDLQVHETVSLHHSFIYIHLFEFVI